MKVKSLSCVQLFATPWTVAQQAPLWDFPGNNTGVGCHFFLQGGLPNPGIEPRSPTLQADALPSDPPGKQPPSTSSKIISSSMSSSTPFPGFPALFLYYLSHDILYIFKFANCLHSLPNQNVISKRAEILSIRFTLWSQGLEQCLAHCGGWECAGRKNKHLCNKWINLQQVKKLMI